ncbi:MAG: hypothetical protein ACRDSS_05960, partial [Actinocrinis sp.]
TYQAWRDVGSWHELFYETYGRLVLVKIGGVLLLIGLGYYARMRIASGIADILVKADAGKGAVAAKSSTTQGTAAKLPAAKRPVAKKSVATVKASAATVTEPIGETADGAANEIADTSPAAAATTSPRASAPPRSSGASRNGHGPGMNRPGRRTSRVGGVKPADATSGALEAFSKLRRSVAAETGVALVVLAATAILVTSVPGRGANGLSTQPGSTDVSVPFNTGTASGTVLVLVEPGKIGPNQTHLLLENSKGEPYSPVEVTVQYSLPSRKIGPIDSKVTINGPGHYLDTPTVLSFAGQWQVAITIRSDDFDETTVRVPVSVS